MRDNVPQVWLTAGQSLFRTDRVITAISGNQITLDAPMTDSIDSAYLNPPGGSLAKYSWDRLTKIGIENLRVTAPAVVQPISSPMYTLLTMNVVTDSWVRDLYVKDCTNCISLSSTSKRLTLEDVVIQHTVTADGSSGYPADFSMNGTHVLMNRCKDLGAANVYTIVTQSQGTGASVVLNFESTGAKAIEPHQRWATGFLLDGIDVAGGVNYVNRGTAGSGQGWAIGWGVAWNSTATTFNVDDPPGAVNWAIGSKGTTTGSTGTLESSGTFVKPSSLFLAQMCQRLGPQAIQTLGY